MLEVTPARAFRPSLQFERAERASATEADGEALPISRNRYLRVPLPVRDLGVSPHRLRCECPETDAGTPRETFLRAYKRGLSALRSALPKHPQMRTLDSLDRLQRN